MNFYFDFLRNIKIQQTTLPKKYRLHFESKPLYLTIRGTLKERDPSLMAKYYQIVIHLTYFKCKTFNLTIFQLLFACL